MIDQNKTTVLLQSIDSQFYIKIPQMSVSLIWSLYSMLEVGWENPYHPITDMENILSITSHYHFRSEQYLDVQPADPMEK